MGGFRISFSSKPDTGTGTYKCEIMYAGAFAEHVLLRIDKLQLANITKDAKPEVLFQVISLKHFALWYMLG